MLDMDKVEGYVKGEIFPIVGYGEDQSYPLKYEDALFLKEAFLERKNWQLGKDDVEKTVPMGRRINGYESVFADCVRCEDSSWGFVKKDRTVRPGVVESFQTKYRGSKEVFDAEEFLDEHWSWLLGEDCELEKINARVGGAILVKHLNAAYKNLEKLEKSAIARNDTYAPWLYSSGKIRYVEASGGDGEEDEMKESDWGNTLFCDYHYTSQTSGSGVWAANVSQSRFEDSTSPLPQFAKSMWAVFRVSVAFEAGATYVNGEEFVDIVALKFDRTVSAQSVYEELMSLVLGHHGRTFMKEPQKSAKEWEDTSVSVHGIALFVENDFPATP
jgi:hypothetical protein